MISEVHNCDCMDFMRGLRQVTEKLLNNLTYLNDDRIYERKAVEGV